MTFPVAGAYMSDKCPILAVDEEIGRNCAVGLKVANGKSIREL
jgi:hypothetical protein